MHLASYVCIKEMHVIHLGHRLRRSCAGTVALAMGTLPLLVS